MSAIVSTTRLTPRHTEYVIEAPEITLEAGPGQLVMVRFEDEERPSPHPIGDIDRVKGTITIVAARGGGEAVDTRAAPKQVAEITGPIGQRSHTRTGGKVLFVAHGLGVAALLPRIRACKQEGCYTIAAAGFLSKDLVFWQEKISPHCDELYVTTRDGSYGIKGSVRHAIRAVCEHNNDIEQAVVLGPVPILKKAVEATRRYEIPTIVSLTAAMDTDTDIAGGGEDAPAAGTQAENTPAEISPASQSTFDWSSAADLDGYTANFDDIIRQLGIQPVK